MQQDFVKITNGAYRILDSLPEGEPLKTKAKEKALEILEGLTLMHQTQGWVSLKNVLSPESLKVSVTLLHNIEVLENYLKLGKGQGWIPVTNFLIITKEYQNIKNGITLPKGVLMAGGETAVQLVGENLKSHAPNLKTEVLAKPATLASPDQNQIAKIQNSNPSPGGLSPKEENYSARQHPSSDKLSARQRKILQILAKNQKAQVSDLIKELPTVTKRTIRRDLDDLLKGGRIVRVGEFNQVYYKMLPSDTQGQRDKGAKGALRVQETWQYERMESIAIAHSIEDIAQFFSYKEGAFASSYNPELAYKIRSIHLPEKITSIDHLESIIKNSLTPEEQSRVQRHLAERMDELRNGSKNYGLFNRTNSLS